MVGGKALRGEIRTRLSVRFSCFVIHPEWNTFWSENKRSRAIEPNPGSNESSGDRIPSSGFRLKIRHEF